jgi:folate-binding protein YgfZ
VRDPRHPELGWRGYGAQPPAGAVEVPESEREAQKLRLGVPGPADWGSDRTYPIEADFDLLHGIDFKKGCFVGQETTSRMKRRGQIKTRILPIVFDGPPPAAGTEVLAGERRAGEVLSGQPASTARSAPTSPSTAARPARTSRTGWRSHWAKPRPASPRGVRQLGAEFRTRLVSRPAIG